MNEQGLATASLLEKDWSQFSIEQSTQEEIDEIERPIAELFLRYTKSEFLEEAFKREIIGYPVANARDILDDPHLKDREFWRTLDPSLFGEPIRFPGIFAQFSESVPPAFRTAPRLGQHNDTIYQGELGLTEGEIARLRKEKVL